MCEMSMRTKIPMIIPKNCYENNPIDFERRKTMAKVKKIVGVSVFLVLAVALAMFWFFLMNGETATPATNSEKAVSASARLVKTKEKNFTDRSTATYITLQQSDLFHMSDIIFTGIYTRNENYTYVYYENGKEYYEYYTFYYFTVKDIYYGDETWLGKEFQIMEWNSDHHGMIYEIVLKENADYLVFSNKHADPELEKAAGGPIYISSLYQMIFEINKSDVFITHELFGRNTREKRVDSVVADFMDSWVKKQFSENNITIDKDKTLDDGRLQENTEKNIFRYENIDDIRNALDINEVRVQTDVGFKNRLSMKKSMLDDFLYAGIQYYIIDGQAPGGGYAYVF